MDWEKVIVTVFVPYISLIAIAAISSLVRFLVISFRLAHDNTASILARVWCFALCVAAVSVVPLAISVGGLEKRLDDESVTPMPLSMRREMAAEIFLFVIIPALVGVARGFRATRKEIEDVRIRRIIGSDSDSTSM